MSPRTVFLAALRAICDEHGILLIADEVQSGFARTGKMFAMDHTGVIPDLMTMAKVAGWRLPAVRRHRPRRSDGRPGRRRPGGTYAGSPLALAAAEAVIEVIAEDKLCERAQLLGDKLKAKLDSLKADIPHIALPVAWAPWRWNS